MKTNPPKHQPQTPPSKQDIRRANALRFFDELILSLTKRKRVWTPADRMRYNRVAAFLKGARA